MEHTINLYLIDYMTYEYQFSYNIYIVRLCGLRNLQNVKGLLTCRSNHLISQGLYHWNHFWPHTCVILPNKQFDKSDRHATMSLTHQKWHSGQTGSQNDCLNCPYARVTRNVCVGDVKPEPPPQYVTLFTEEGVSCIHLYLIMYAHKYV